MGIGLPGPGKAGAEVYTAIPEEILPQGGDAHLEIVEVIVVDQKALAGVGGIALRQGVKALPGGKIVIRGAGGRRPAVKERPVDKKDLRGLGQGQDHLPAVYLPLLQKGGDEPLQLLLGEEVPVVHQDVLLRQGQHGFGVGYEHIRQGRRAGVLVGGGQHALVDAGRKPDALLRTAEKCGILRGTHRISQSRYSFGKGGADMRKKLLLCLLALAVLAAVGCGKQKAPPG